MFSSDEDAACPLLESSDGRSRRRKYNKHSLEQQLQCVAVAKQTSNRKAARRFGVDEKCVRRWRNNEKDIAEQQFHEVLAGGKRARLSGAGRKTLFDADAERELVNWLKAKRGRNERVTRQTVLQQAAGIAADRHLSSFKGSAGWLRGFLRRHCITPRRRATACEKPSSELVQKIIDFLMFVGRVRIQDGYGCDALYACAETDVWPDSAASTAGDDKQRLTVVLTARADGRKLRPFVLLPRKRPLQQFEKFKKELEIVYCDANWMDDALTATYLGKILGPSLFLQKGLLLWGLFHCHVNDATKKKLKQLNIDTAVVPRDCAKYVQPAEASWNRPFKAHFQAQYDSFMASCDQQTASPPIEMQMQWIADAWQALTPELVARSFVACGVNAMDGCEDDAIHFFRPEGAFPGGRALLDAARKSKEGTAAQGPSTAGDEGAFSSDTSLEC